MKLQQPILFHTVEELQEAVEYGIIKKTQIEFYVSEDYALPALFWNLENGNFEHQHNNKVLLDPNDECLSLLRKSVDWKHIRDQYKPKEWYELEYSVGKPVWVRDSQDEEWQISLFRFYTKGSGIPYRCGYSYWTYAKPVTVEDLI